MFVSVGYRCVAREVRGVSGAGEEHQEVEVVQVACLGICLVRCFVMWMFVCNCT